MPPRILFVSLGRCCVCRSPISQRVASPQCPKSPMAHLWPTRGLCHSERPSTRHRLSHQRQRRRPSTSALLRSSLAHRAHDCTRAALLIVGTPLVVATTFRRCVLEAAASRDTLEAASCSPTGSASRVAVRHSRSTRARCCSLTIRTARNSSSDRNAACSHLQAAFPDPESTDARATASR